MDLVALSAEELKDWAVEAPLRIALITIGTWIVVRIAGRAIRVTLARAASTRSARGGQRIEALAAVMASAAAFVIWTIGAFMILAELGVNLGPLLAGAGVVGLAIGFGAQALVRDVVAGTFMLIEDQLAVGDRVSLSEEAEGTVEDISLRVTRIRGEDGTVWYFPNGAIERVANRSQ